MGYEEGGQLTEAVRRKPYSVVLFDEVEKAHPDVFNILLQVLDDGRITDSQGRTVDFKNTILILTSNLGSQYLLEGIDAQGEISQEARDQVDQLLKRSFRPEFLNRLDEIVYYKPLTKENVTAIVDLLLGSLNRRLADKQLKVELTPAPRPTSSTTGTTPSTAPGLCAASSSTPWRPWSAGSSSPTRSCRTPPWWWTARGDQLVVR